MEDNVYKIIPSKEQEVIRKRNSDFFKSLRVFKDDYIISTVIRTYPKDFFKDPTNRKPTDTKIFYIFNKDTSFIRVTKDEEDEIEPLQVFDIKDNSTCGGGFFMHMFSKIDVEAEMKQIDIDLGEEYEPR